jgi:hypothetical protein
VRLYGRAQQKTGDQTGKKRGIHDGGSLKSQWAAAQARCEGESRRARAAKPRMRRFAYVRWARPPSHAPA